MISSEQMSAYLDEAQRVVGFCLNNKIPIFAAALAGASLIRLSLSTMGGDPEWWHKLIDPKTDVDALFAQARQKQGR